MLRTFLTICASAAALLFAVSAALGATPQSSPGQVATRLGSPDPREHVQRSSFLAGLVPTRLGSQDPRDTARSTGVSFGANLPPSAAIKASSANWAAKAKLLDVNGRPEFAVAMSPASSAASASTGFNWGDFGMGVAATLGLVLLGMGLLAGAHYRRKGSVRPRPVS